MPRPFAPPAALRIATSPCAGSARNHFADRWPARRPSSWTAATACGLASGSRRRQAPPAPRLLSTRAALASCDPSPSHHEVDEFPLDDDHLAQGFALDEALHLLLSERGRGDCRVIRLRCHRDVAAQLAVDLHDELELLFSQRIGCGLRHGGVEQVAEVARMTQP